MIEVYFLMQLLTVRGGDMESLADLSPDLDELNYLGSVHNAVYFVTSVLKTQHRLVSSYDTFNTSAMIPLIHPAEHCFSS